MPEITSPAFCISAHAPPVPLMLKKYLSPVKICGIRFALFAKDAFNPSYSGRRRLFFLNTELSQVCSIAYMRSSTYFSAPNFPFVVFQKLPSTPLSFASFLGISEIWTTAFDEIASFTYFSTFAICSGVSFSSWLKSNLNRSEVILLPL